MPTGSARRVPALIAALAMVVILQSPARAVAERRPPPAQSIDPAAAASAAICEKTPHHVFVTTPLGTECIGYYISAGFETAKTAVLHFHGDFTPDLMGSAEKAEATARGFQKGADRAAEKFKFPFIFVARPGVLESTGDHMKRRQPKEFISINAAIDAIKQRHGIETIALSGQSGGGSVVGAMLTLGRRDIVCAVPGSGAFDVVGLFRLRRTLAGKPPTAETLDRFRQAMYSPIEHIDQIVAAPQRRIFVVGDPRDKNTFFEQQRDFAYRVKTAGHHAVLLYAPGAGDKRHGVGAIANEVAGLCLQGKTDDEIETAMGDWWMREFARPRPLPSDPTKPRQYSNALPPEQRLRLVTPEAPAAIPARVR